MKTMARAVMAVIVASIFTLAVVECANADIITATFTATSSKIIGGVAPGSYLYINAPYEFQITNNTGVTWTDFHLQTSTGGFVDDTYAGPGAGAFTNTYFVAAAPPTFPSYTGAGHLDITSINIAPLGILDFTTNLAIGPSESAGFLGILVTGNPTTGGVPPTVPEPSTLLLIGSGLIGLLGVRKKFRK
jgi:hypothetical protein